jgi:undecaprenyl-diphosphatase
MTPLQALILGLVEGLTEYLPVSSTGHLILTTHAFGVSKDAADTFDVVIQIGAILAVLAHFRVMLMGHARGLLRREPASLGLLVNLVIAFVPTAVIGLLFRKIIKRVLFDTVPIAIALVLGGIVMIVAERLLPRAAVSTTGASSGTDPDDDVANVTRKQALWVGLGQCIALIPGASRSMCTIVAGRMAGLRPKVAAEFAFLLGLPTLGGASLIEAYKDRHLLAALGWSNLAIGVVVSFFVAWAVIAAFLRYLQRAGLTPFGVYRILFGAVVLVWALR